MSFRRKVACSTADLSEVLGFFVGYLVNAKSYEYLQSQPPECMVFAIVRPVGGKAYQRLVEPAGSLLRKTHEYIGWLTHQPPRFALPEGQEMVLVRHQSMRDWPRGKYQHLSRNFFIEALCWLVRSGLVRKFIAERLAGPVSRVSKAKKTIRRRSLRVSKK